MLQVSGTRREQGLGNNDLSSLVVDVEGHMARFVAKTWEERNSLVLTACACAAISAIFPSYIYSPILVTISTKMLLQSSKQMIAARSILIYRN